MAEPSESAHSQDHASNALCCLENPNIDAQGGEPGTSKRPLENGSANPAVKQRNKRLFGSLLGTLQKFQEEDQRFKRSRLAQSRAEAEQRAEQRAAAEAEKMREKHRQDIAKARLDELNKKRELEVKLQAKRNEIRVAQQIERESRLGRWLKTAVRPALLWLPKFHNEDTQLLLEQRRADLDAWKEAQLSKLQSETAQIEARYQPLPPRPFRGVMPTGSAQPDADAHAKEPAADVTDGLQGGDDAAADQTAAEPERYEATEDDVALAAEAALAEEADEVPDDGLTGDVEGVKDLL